MLLTTNELLSQEFEWTTTAADTKIPNSNVKLVSPYFGLVNSVGDDNTFRFAIRQVADKVKVHLSKTIVYCYVYNLEKLGVKVNTVECTIGKKIVPLRLKVNGTIIKLFISDEEYLGLNSLPEKGISLKYRMYLSPTHWNQRVRNRDYFGYELRDTCFGEEMWSAAQKGVMTDCEFIVQNQKFLAHRAVVASRSPVLAERIKISETNNNSIEIQDVTNPIVFKALLYFLYTGLLLHLGSSNQRLFVDLAKCYQVKVAEQIHEVFEHSAHSVVTRQSQEFSKLLIDVQSIVHPDRDVDLRENYGSVSVVRRGICLLYDYKRSFNLTDTIDPHTFRFGEGGFLGVTASKITNDRGISYYCELTCSVHVLSGFKLDIVKCSTGYGFAENVNGLTMSKISEDDKVDLKLFREKFAFPHLQSESHSFNVRFSVYLTEVNERWGYRLHDPSLPLQLWSASEKEMFTDVELKVQYRTFHAHRAILSARSPVFCAMFGSDMNESHTGIVEIKDINTGVFGDFLEFLYTGKLKTTSNLEELWTVANKYNVKTLEQISKPYTVKVEIGDFPINLLSEL